MIIENSTYDSCYFSGGLPDDLNRIETEIKKVHVPLSYAEELYDLRLHLTLVRNQVEDKRT